MSLFQSSNPMENYVILQTLPLENPFFLSSQIMKWNPWGPSAETIWIINLQPTLNYWKKQASLQKLPLREFIEKIIYSNTKAPFSGVFCDHPWQGLLTLKAMNTTGFRQLIRQKGHFGQKLYSNMSWDHWWDLTEETATFLETQTQFNKWTSSLPTQLRQMKKSMKRLQVDKPADLQAACSSSIEKRYGPMIKKAWEWTFYGLNTKKEEPLPLFQHSNQNLDYFPWTPFRLSLPVLAERLLNHPLNQWDLIEPLLKMDCYKISQKLKKGELIQTLKWSITLDNLDVLHLPIQFRNPYDLKEDQSTGFKSALHQSYYAFEAYIRRQNSPEIEPKDEFVEYFYPSPIIAWQLNVEQSLYLSPQTIALIPCTLGAYNKNKELSQVLELENKLPLEVENYRLASSFIPGSDFYSTKKEVPEQHASPSALSKKDLDQLWQSSGLSRPLFLFNQSESIPKPNTKEQLLFLERCFNKWWQQDPQKYNNDFYQLSEVAHKLNSTTSQKQLSWISNNGTQWLRHGYFD